MEAFFVSVKGSSTGELPQRHTGWLVLQCSVGEAACVRWGQGGIYGTLIRHLMEKAVLTKKKNVLDKYKSANYGLGLISHE